ncbi:MAG: TIGR03960 family B12-binding radical SAM protein [Thermodesulfovibrionales bacterium]|nr:TIGR03960 family B12-binding radical SAM protein [Thermodesulfovibrionales bacterium]
MFISPSRYINSEINSIKKKHQEGIILNCALVFPDIYEVGMSHIGLKILYEIINSLPYASAERAFSPWIDHEHYLRYNNLKLTSLESHKPLKDFDLVGFSLQYELSYPTVLNILDLAGIPIYTEDRLNHKGHQPLVIAGGPSTVNPLPLKPFIDAFLIGDGEEAILELLETMRRWKIENGIDRESLLKEIAKIEGFYVPILHKNDTKIKRRFIPDLDLAPYPLKPIVPFKRIIHDRVAVEISRGCAMGCRFCQAGIIYRPLRMRSPQKVIEIAEKSLDCTGYEELSLVSLSSGDYPFLYDVMRKLNNRFKASKVALSLPSLRVGSVNKEILKEIKSVKKTGFTIAPEVATDRLRSIINKNFSEEDYEKALITLFSEGWLNLKLYFMIGLPFEQQQDIEEIPKMVTKAIKIAKRYSKRFVNISVTISPFNPKPHTPFQWFGRASSEDIQKKLTYLKEIFFSKKIKFKGHNENISLLEAAFSRADENISKLILKAWELGCRLDAWTECFDFNKWNEAMNITSIDVYKYAEKSYKIDDPLPWGIIDVGVKKSFLVSELQKAISSQRSYTCNKSCLSCGINCTEIKKQQTLLKNIDENSQEKSEDFYKILSQDTLRVRVEYCKKDLMRYLSHHELISTILRGLRRAKIPVVYSQGFTPSPLVSFCPPLNVGVEGEREYFDMIVFEPFDLIKHQQTLNTVLPEGIKVSKMAIISKDEPSLDSFIRRYEYQITIDNDDLLHLKSKKHEIEKKDKKIDISENIEDIILNIDVKGKQTINIILKDTDTYQVRLSEVVEKLFNKNINELKIRRLNLFGWKKEWVVPL